MFLEGLSLEDSEQHPADKKTVNAFMSLLELCANELNGKSAIASRDDSLPPSLRSGAWPPQKAVPTAPIKVTAPFAPAPQFRFPPDWQLACEQIYMSHCNKQYADEARSGFSNFISTIEEYLTEIENTDWNLRTEKFIQNHVFNSTNDFQSSRILRAKFLLNNHRTIANHIYHIERDYRGYRNEFTLSSDSASPIIYKKYLSFQTIIPIIGETNIRIWTNDEELLGNNEFVSYAEKIMAGVIFTEWLQGTFLLNGVYNPMHNVGNLDPADILKYFELKLPLGHCDKLAYCALAYRVGPAISNALQDITKRGERGDHYALRCLSYLDADSLASFMADMLTIPAATKHAQAWFRFFPETAVTGLLRCALQSNFIDRCNAQQALRFLAERGSRQLVIDCALKFGTDAQAVVVEFLGHNSQADFVPKKMPKLPDYLAHTAPILKETGEALPAHAVETLMRMMLVSTCHLQNSALQDVIEACDRQSLADFALSTFEMWSRNGARKDGIGFLHALAYFGDNRAAVLLSKTYRHAPPTVATPVIEVLAAMGSNTAIAGIQAIARTSLNEKSREIAQEVLEDVARDRGLTAAMLEDLAVPDLGLGSDGQMSLDFGPRRFVAKVDSMLDAILMDDTGGAVKTLPKVLKTDDAQKAKAATTRWKEFRSALKSQAADQRKRFEQAMLSRREWVGATFKEVVANHPLLLAMVRSLVWAKMKDQAIDTTFRVDAGGRFVTAGGSELPLEDDARVTLPHPLLLGGAMAAWVQIFAEHQLAQPFPQLARKWFAKNADTEALIRARDGTKVPLGSLWGLKANGWAIKEGGAGLISRVFKSIDGGRASIDVEPGWSISGFDYEDFGGDQTVKMEVYGSDPIAYSEMVRELLSLPIAEG